MKSEKPDILLCEDNWYVKMSQKQLLILSNTAN